MNKRNEIDKKTIATLIMTMLMLSMAVAAIPIASADTVDFNVCITDDSSNFGDQSNEAVGIPITSGLTLNQLFAGAGLQYTYTVIDGGQWAGASPVVAVIDLLDGSHVVLFPGWGARTETYTLQFSDTVAQDTGGNNLVDCRVYDANFIVTWHNEQSHPAWTAIKGLPDFPNIGSAIVTRIAIQHQGATTGQKDMLVSLTFEGLEVTDPVTFPVEDETVPVGDMGTVTVKGTGTITTYECDEGPGAGFSSSTGDYFDVSIGDGSDVDSLIITYNYEGSGLPIEVERGLIMYWYDGATWSPCSDTGVKMLDNYIYATITDITSPTLAQMTGTPFGPGGSIELNAEYYRTGDDVTVTIVDADANERPFVLETISATASSDMPDQITVTLTETGVNTGVFTGTFLLVSADQEPGDNELVVVDENQITATYYFTESESVTATAFVDDLSPTVEVNVDPVLAKAETVTFTLTFSEDMDIAIDPTVKFIPEGKTAITITGDWSEASVTEWVGTYAVTDSTGDGEAIISVSGAKDPAGNMMTVDTSTTFVIDTTAPLAPDAEHLVVSMKAPGTDDTIAGNAGAVEASATVNVYSDEDCTDLIESVQAADDGSFTAISIGDNAFSEIWVTATDAVGNEGTATKSINVFIDVEDPVIVFKDVTYPVGVYSARVGDEVIIEAIVTDDLSGVATVTLGETPMELNEYGIWTATLYIGTNTPSVTFIPEITATDNAENEATTTITIVVTTSLTGYNVNLDEGWNLVSLPLVPDESSIENVLGDAITSTTTVWSYDAETEHWFMYATDNPSSDLTTMVDGKGYWMDMSEVATLSITGLELPAPPTTLPAYDVVIGWNLIGFKEINNDMLAPVYLDGVEYVRLYAFEGGNWKLIKLDMKMTPGYGYWIAVTAAGTIYP